METLTCVFLEKVVISTSDGKVVNEGCSVDQHCPLWLLEAKLEALQPWMKPGGCYDKTLNCECIFLFAATGTFTLSALSPTLLI